MVLSTTYITWTSLDNVSYPDLRTSRLDLPYAHVHHHGSGRVVGVHQGRQVAAVDFTDVPQVGFTVVGHQRGALFVDVQPTVCRRTHSRVTFARSGKSNRLVSNFSRIRTYFTLILRLVWIRVDGLMCDLR